MDELSSIFPHPTRSATDAAGQLTVDHVLVRSGRSLATISFEARVEATPVETIDEMTTAAAAALLPAHWYASTQDVRPRIGGMSCACRRVRLVGDRVAHIRWNGTTNPITRSGGCPSTACSSESLW